MSADALAEIDQIPVIDNHCHPIVRDQRLTLDRWIDYFSPSHDTARNVPYTVFYRWAIRQLAAYLGVDADAQAVLDARNSRPLEQYVRGLAENAGIAGLVEDEGYPIGEGAYSAQETADLFGVRCARLIRLELLIQRLAAQTDSFAATEERFRTAVANTTWDGFAGFKSIAAYRTGLALSPVERGEAEAAFAAVQREAHERGTVRLASKPVVDYFCAIALAEADRQGLPFQFHTGYGDPDVDLLLANPLHLRDAIERYPRAAIVLLHESYPYMRQAAFLAMVYPNVYMDVSMVLPPLDWRENLHSFRQALGVAPPTGSCTAPTRPTSPRCTGSAPAAPAPSCA